MILYLVLSFVLILVIVFAISVQFLSRLHINSYSFLSQNSLLMYAFTLAFLFVVVVLGTCFSEIVPLFTLPSGVWHWLVSTVIILLSVILGLLLFKLEIWVITITVQQQAQAHVLAVSYWQNKWFIPIVVLIVLMEEIIWRAYLPLAISQQWSIPLLWAAFISSLAFGLHHVFFGWKHVILKSVYGYVWLLLTLKFESLLPAITSHCAFNFAVYWHSANQINASIKGYKELQD